MKNITADTSLIQKYEKPMGGVFTLSNIAALTMEAHKNELYRRIKRLEEEGTLRRFAREIYISSNYSKAVLSQKLRENSYVSFGNVLADNLMIGAIPALQIDAVALGRSKSFSKHGFTVRYFGISQVLFFGFDVHDGIKVATPEKALLDTLYFHQHGARFFFDIFSDVNVSKLNRRTIDKYLKKYKNPKFKAFAKDYLDERGLEKSKK